MTNPRRRAWWWVAATTALLAAETAWYLTWPTTFTFIRGAHWGTAVIAAWHFGYYDGQNDQTGDAP